MFSCSVAFLSLALLCLFLYLFVVFTCIAAVYIPWPLFPAFVNEKAGNLSQSKCVNYFLVASPASSPSQ